MYTTNILATPADFDQMLNVKFWQKPCGNTLKTLYIYLSYKQTTQAVNTLLKVNIIFSLMVVDT